MRLFPSALLPLLLALPLLGCTPTTTVLRPYTPPRPPTQADALADVARVRGYSMSMSVPIHELPEADFNDQAHLREGQPRSGGHSHGFFEAFSMGTGAEAAKGARALYDAELGGFYDPQTKELYVRRGTKTSDTTARLILEHEVEHAYQDHVFGFPDMDRLGMDAWLAVRALYEGDATVTAVTAEGARIGEAPEVAVASLVRMPDKSKLATLARSDPADARNAMPLVKEAILWPYVGGTGFVASLANTGGWDLVNLAFEHPPTTTEQVLHVEKFLAGEQPIPVAVPHVPAGYRGEQAGSMGELATRVFLAQCSSDGVARDAARGWGGDSFAIVSKGEASALLWMTAWDDGLAAARFAKALDDRHACARTGAKPAFVAVREGNRVAFVQGLEDAEARRREAELLFPLVGVAPAPSPPSPTPVTLRPPPPAMSDFAHRGEVVGDAFVDDAIGVRAPLFGMHTTPMPDLELKADADFVSVAMALAWAAPSHGLEDAFMGGMLETLRKERPADAAALRMADPGRVTLSWTQAYARRVVIGDREEQRLVLAPVCGGKMTLVLVARWRPGTFGQDTALDWLRGIRVTDDSPACQALRSLRSLAPRKGTP